MLLLYALLSVKRSAAKPLWFDELGTLNVASQPTLAQMFRVEPADGNPPLQYLLVRPCLHALGVNALALRLPAMVFLALGLVCAYVLVARRWGAAAALVAPTLLLVSRVGDYGVEARPYALLMGLLGLTLVLWQRAAASEEKRGPTLAGLAATVFALVIAQPMGVLWASVPLGAAEAFRCWRTRRPDVPMLAAILLGLSGFAITLGFGRATERVLSANAGHNHSAIALPTWGKLFQSLQVEGLLPALALLAGLALLALWLRAAKKPCTDTLFSSQAPAHEWVAVGALVLTIPVVYLFTAVVTHYFWARYIVPGVFGGFLLVGMACGAAGKRQVAGRRQMAAATLLLGLGLLWMERRGMVAATAATPTDSVVPSLLTQGNPSLPIVIGKPFFFPEIWWYSPPALRARLHYIADVPEASRTTDFVPEMTLLAMHQAGSSLFPPDGLQPFLMKNRRFLLWHHFVAQGCWLEDDLHARHYTFTAVRSSAAGDETLYEVAAP